MKFKFFLWPSIINAQQMIQDDTVNPIPGNQSLGQTGGFTENRDNGINWWWLLPLLAIPIIYLLLRDKKVEDKSNYQDRNMVGSKGGRTTSKPDNETF